MSAGVIPLITRECGLDEGEFIPIENVDVPYLAQLVHEYANKDVAWINNEARSVQNVVHSRYMKRNFYDSVYNALMDILKR